MRKQVFSIAILTILALSLSAAAKAKVDFTGTWKLDTAKSSGLPAGMEQTMTVTQTGDTIKLDMRLVGDVVCTEQNVWRVTYLIDNKSGKRYKIRKY